MTWIDSRLSEIPVGTSSIGFATSPSAQWCINSFEHGGIGGRLGIAKTWIGTATFSLVSFNSDGYTLSVNLGSSDNYCRAYIWAIG